MERRVNSPRACANVEHVSKTLAESLTLEEWFLLGRAIARRMEVLSDEEIKAIQAAFNTAYRQDQEAAEAAVRVRGPRRRADSLKDPLS